MFLSSILFRNVGYLAVQDRLLKNFCKLFESKIHFSDYTIRFEDLRWMVWLK